MKTSIWHTITYNKTLLIYSNSKQFLQDYNVQLGLGFVAFKPTTVRLGNHFGKEITLRKNSQARQCTEDIMEENKVIHIEADSLKKLLPQQIYLEKKK